MMIKNSHASFNCYLHVLIRKIPILNVWNHSYQVIYNMCIRWMMLSPKVTIWIIVHTTSFDYMIYLWRLISLHAEAIVLKRTHKFITGKNVGFDNMINDDYDIYLLVLDNQEMGVDTSTFGTTKRHSFLSKVK